jgi:flagellin
MINVRATLTRLADGTINSSQRDQYNAQYAALKTQMDNFISDATYNGRTLLSTDTAAGGGDIVAIRNEAAGTFTITAVDAAADMVLDATVADATAAQTSLDAGGNFKEVEAAVADALNKFGSDSNYVDGQIRYNKDKIDAMEGGLGALVDADLAKESAKLQSLQIRQQLGTQALSISNQAPQTLLSLFR